VRLKKARFVTSELPNTGEMSSKTACGMADRVKGDKTDPQNSPQNRESQFQRAPF
jgi:hypothetical protein